MTDATYVAAVLSSLKTATDIAKILRETDVSLEQAESKLQLAELMGALADAKVGAAELQLSLAAKDEEIRQLQDAISLRASVVRRNDAYYEHNEDGEPTGDPCCSRCWEVDHRLVHTVIDPLMYGIRTCPSCKAQTSSKDNPSY